jgi:fermentation-respiration switch protein FrsA (DUF1100 family)
MLQRIAGLGLMAAGGYAALSFLAHRSIYFPMRYPQGWWNEQRILGAEDVQLVTRDGVKLHGWWKESRGAEFATLFLHGNAGNVTHRGRSIRAITEAGSSVLAPDYRGYGKSEGSPSEKGLYADADAAYEWLAGKGYDGARLIIHGESLGTAVAVELASRRPCRGLILEAPFPSARAAAGTVLPVIGPALVWGFDSRGRIGRARAPLLVIHGSHDEVIPLSLGRALFDAANEPKQMWVVKGAHHNDLFEVGGTEYVERLRSFYYR